MKISIKQIRHSLVLVAVCASIAATPALPADQTIIPVPTESAGAAGKVAPATVDPAS
ncbi:MAG: hypothetical protein ACD_39C00960G0001, partial [uncultured bacterium]